MIAKNRSAEKIAELVAEIQDGRNRETDLIGERFLICQAVERFAREFLEHRSHPAQLQCAVARLLKAKHDALAELPAE